MKDGATENILPSRILSSDSRNLDILTTLYEDVGKEFANRVFDTLGFDYVMDKKTNGADVDDSIMNTETLLRNIAGNINDSISIAKNDSRKRIYEKIELYLKDLEETDSPTFEQIHEVLKSAVSDMTKELDSLDSGDELFYQFLSLFQLSTEIRFGAMERIEKTSEEMLGYTVIGSHDAWPNKVKTNEKINDLFLEYLKKFHTKMNGISQEEKIKVVFLYEALRKQSGKREGIGNGMNWMYLDASIQHLFHGDYISHLKGKEKIMHKIKSFFPKTNEGKIKQMRELLGTIVSKDLMFGAWEEEY